MTDEIRLADAPKNPPAPGERASQYHQIRPELHASAQSVERAWTVLLAKTRATQTDKSVISDEASIQDAEAYSPNIENFIGTVKVPLGVVGPLAIDGTNVSGNVYVPLATTEAALVSSYGRGVQAIARSGGAETVLVSEGVTRAPVFRFASLAQTTQFRCWVEENLGSLRAAAEGTSRFISLVALEPFVEGPNVYLNCRYTTGDAAGQNMVTFATEAVCAFIEAHSPVTPCAWYLESNFSGDKKASAHAFNCGRGRHATAAITIPSRVVSQCLKTSPEKMFDYWQLSSVGGVLSGAIGIQGHFANALAALYIATGQDAACVAESAVGVTRMELRGADLFVAVTLPNLMSGTVGGGTGLPSQAAGLRILGLEGEGSGAAFAEVTAALCLAGEISIIAALSGGEFGRAHHALARGRR